MADDWMMGIDGTCSLIITLTGEQREKIKAAAAYTGETVEVFVTRAVMERVKASELAAKYNNGTLIQPRYLPQPKTYSVITHRDGSKTYTCQQCGKPYTSAGLATLCCRTKKKKP